MLPFLKPRKLDSIVMMNSKPEGGLEPENREDENHALMAVAEDLIKAIHAKDTKGVADALEAASDVCGMSDHMEPEEGIE